MNWFNILLGPHPALVLQINDLRKEVMAEYEDLKMAIQELGAKIDAWLAINQADVEARIDAELAKDEALDNVGLAALKADVLAIMARVPPLFEPSNQ